MSSRWHQTSMYYLCLTLHPQILVLFVLSPTLFELHEARKLGGSSEFGGLASSPWRVYRLHPIITLIVLLPFQVTRLILTAMNFWSRFLFIVSDLPTDGV